MPDDSADRPIASRPRALVPKRWRLPMSCAI